MTTTTAIRFTNSQRAGLPDLLPARGGRMMTGPARIQRRRTAGWRMPAGAVYVGRPTRWGNPFTTSTPTPTGRAEAVARYRAWLAGRPDLIAAARAELAGKTLACWCPPGQPCHADVLLTIANTAS